MTHKKSTRWNGFMGEDEAFEPEIGDPFFPPSLYDQREALKSEMRFERFKRYRDLRDRTELCLGDAMELEGLRKEFIPHYEQMVGRSTRIPRPEPEYTDLDGYDRDRDDRYMDAF